MIVKQIPLMARSVVENFLKYVPGFEKGIKQVKKATHSSTDEDHSADEDNVWSDDDENGEDTEESLNKYIEKKKIEMISLKDKFKKMEIEYQVFENDFQEKCTRLTKSNESLDFDIKGINLPEIQKKAKDIEVFYNKLNEGNIKMKNLQKDNVRIGKKLEKDTQKYDSSVQITSQNASEEEKFRRNELQNKSAMDDDQKMMTNISKSLKETHDEIQKNKSEAEALFPPLVFFDGNFEQDLEFMETLIHTEQEIAANTSAKLTKMKNELKESENILKSTQNEFGTKTKNLETKKEEISKLQTNLDEKMSKLEPFTRTEAPTKEPGLSGDSDMTADSNANADSEIFAENELENDTEYKYHTEDKRLQVMLANLETEKSDLDIESSRLKQGKIDDTCKSVQEHKKLLDEFKIELIKHNECIVKMELELEALDLSSQDLKNEHEQLMLETQNTDSIDQQKFLKLEQETERCQLELDKEKTEILTITKKISDNHIDLSSCFEYFTVLVSGAEFSTGSETNLDDNVQHVIDLQMIERSKLDLILEQEKALNDQIAETTTKKKSVEVEFEEAKKLIHTPKNDLSLSFGATFTHKGTKNGKPQSLEHITKQKKSASSTYESTSELAPKGHQTHDESKSTVGGDTGPIRMILPPSTMPFISKDMKGESHVPPVSHTESHKSEAEHDTPSLTSKANTSSQLPRMDTTHTTAKKNSSPQVSPKASVTHLDLSKSSIDAVHTNETPQVSISTTSKKHILSDTAEDLRIIQEETDRKQKETVASQQKMSEIQRKQKDIVEQIKLAEEAEKVSPQTPAGKKIFIQLKSDLVKIEHEFKVAEKKKEEDVAKLFALTKQKEKIIDDDKRSKSFIPTPTILHSASLQAILTKLKRKPHIRDDTSYTMTKSISDVPLLMTGVDPTTIAAALTRHLLCDFHAILRDASTYDYEVDADCIAENSESLCRVKMPNQDIMFVEIIPDEANKSNPVIQLYYQAGSKRSEIIQYRTNNIVEEWCHMLEHR